MSYRLFLSPCDTIPLISQTPDGEATPAGDAGLAVPGAATASETGAVRFDWLLMDASGHMASRGVNQSADEIERLLEQNDLEHVQLIGLLPAHQVTWCQASIPGRQSRFIRQALPFAVEEQLAQDIDTLHLSLGAQRGDTYAVAAIDQGQMAFWSESLNAWSRAQLIALYPDAALLPTNQARWTLCLDGEVALLAGRQGEWLRLPVDALPILLASLESSRTDISTDNDAESIRVFASEADRQAQHLALSALESEGHFKLAFEMLEISRLELLAVAYHQDLCKPINLCQGKFTIASRERNPWWHWRSVAVIAGLWFALQLLLDVGTGIYYQRQAASYQQQAVAAYKKVFPAETRVSANNLRRVLEGKLRAASAAGPTLEFVGLLKHAGYQYALLQGRDKVTFQGINFNRSRGELIVDLQADSFEKINQLKSGLANAGLNAKVGSVVNESSGARGRITLSTGGS